VTKVFERIGAERVVLVWSVWRVYWRRNCGLSPWADRIGRDAHVIPNGGHAWPQGLEYLVTAIGTKELTCLHTDGGTPDGRPCDLPGRTADLRR
jgi:hypothetical protein